jgi:hypothetical protein
MRVSATWLALTVLAACGDPARMTASDGETGGVTVTATGRHDRRRLDDPDQR